MAAQNKCVSSQSYIHVKDGSYAHQHEVEIVFNRINGGRQRILTTGGDCYQKDRCRHILDHFPDLHGIAHAYDGRKILLTPVALGNDIFKVPFQLDDFLHDSLGGEGEILVTITWVRSINISDFSAYQNGDPNVAEDRSLRSILEMILSQGALTRQNHPFSSIGSGQLFELNEVPFDRGTVVRHGNSKGVHIVSSENGPQPLLALNSLKKLFFPSGANFLVFLNNFMGPQSNYAEAARLCRGLKLQLTYNPSRTLTFKDFTDVSFADLPPLEREDGPISLGDYYFNTYNVDVQNIHEPAAIMMQGDGQFPLELLRIVPDQAIVPSRMPDSLRESSLRINRLRPRERYDSIIQQFQRLGMSNQISRAFGVELENNLLRGTFSRLPKMTVIARNNSRIELDDQGSFRFFRNQYVLPGRLDRVVVLSSDRDAHNSMECAKAVVEECRKKGMVVNNLEWVQFDTRRAPMDQFVRQLKKFDNSKTLVVTVDNTRDAHCMIKLAEALSGVPTQHIQWKTASSKKAPVMENIAHKINLKAGGLNHRVLFPQAVRNLDLSRGNVLVIGLDCCHPTGDNLRGPTAEPTFAGITGNYLQEPCAFAGTFFLQNSRQESVSPDTLRMYVLQMLRRVSEHRAIDTIVLMRDGVSEGQYGMVINQELEAIKKAANDHFKEPKCRLVGIVVTKNGNTRHFDDSQRNNPQSLPPRSIVTFGTRENYKQFYMVPHRAMQGTAKAVMVTVLQDEIGLTEDETQKFVMGLTSLHQIVCAPVSLPEPIYQADKLALRGQLVYRCFRDNYPTRVPRHPDGTEDFIQLTNLLSFNNGNLPSIRFTA